MLETSNGKGRQLHVLDNPSSKNIQQAKFPIPLKQTL